MSETYDDAFRGTRALVTGGAGFVGSHIARRLIELGADVTVIDDLSGGIRENIPPQSKFVHASILDDEALRHATRGCERIFHEAAMVSVPESVDDPQKCAAINIVGTERVLDAARSVGASDVRVVFAASAAAYGGAPNLPSKEEDPVDCCSPYAASKVAGEALMSAFARCYPISTVSLRYFNVFGPGQSDASAYAAAISAFRKALASGLQPTVHGDGRQTRDFVFIDNIVHANLLAGASPRAFKGEVINIGMGQRIDLLEVLKQMGLAMKMDVKPTFGLPRAGDVRDSEADITRAREWLGYEPVVSFAEGVHRTLAVG